MISKIFKTFFLLIYLNIILSKKFMISILIYKYKQFKIKNVDGFIKMDILLFIANFAISNFSN